MALKDSVTDVFDALEVFASRARKPMQWLFTVGIGFQGLVTAGAIKLPERWAGAVSILSMVLALYTNRRPRKLRVPPEERRTTKDLPGAGGDER